MSARSEQRPRAQAGGRLWRAVPAVFVHRHHDRHGDPVDHGHRSPAANGVDVLDVLWSWSVDIGFHRDRLTALMLSFMLLSAPLS